MLISYLDLTVDDFGLAGVHRTFLNPGVFTLSVVTVYHRPLPCDRPPSLFTTPFHHSYPFRHHSPEIPIVLDIPTDLPTVPELPAVSPFLCSDDSESESADESPERHVSLRLHVDMVSRWRDRVRFCPSSPSGSSSPDTTIPSTKIATASPACKSTPVIIASPAVRSRIRTTVRKSTLGLRLVMMPSRSAALRKARRAALPLETSSSDTSSGSSSDLAPRVLSLTQADLLPPRKRYRGTSAMHSDESSGEGSQVTQTESDMDSNIRADVEAVTTTAATAIVNGLGIKPVLAGVEAGFEPGLAVVETERQLEDGMQGVYDHLQEIPLQRIDDIESRQIEQEGRNLIADSERSGLLARVVALEGSNTRLRDAICVERVRSDSLQRRLGNVEEELRQVRELHAHESQRLWRMETFMMRTQDYRP
ncbi:hypothetical protein Tco_0753290 [Tanacetum coccineum]